MWCIPAHNGRSWQGSRCIILGAMKPSGCNKRGACSNDLPEVWEAQSGL